MGTATFAPTAAGASGAPAAATTGSQTNDPTRGTFAAAQAADPSIGPITDPATAGLTTGVLTQLELTALDIARLTSGEAVAVRNTYGAEMVGHVFKISGGGKGATGKNRLKFKSELKRWCVKLT
jgi:hypothetical protein